MDRRSGLTTVPCLCFSTFIRIHKFIQKKYQWTYITVWSWLQSPESKWQHMWIMHFDFVSNYGWNGLADKNFRHDQHMSQENFTHFLWSNQCIWGEGGNYLCKLSYFTLWIYNTLKYVAKPWMVDRKWLTLKKSCSNLSLWVAQAKSATIENLLNVLIGDSVILHSIPFFYWKVSSLIDVEFQIKNHFMTDNPTLTRNLGL